MHRRLPVTLVGGFLGAGKTSLLHHLVTGHVGGHLALLVENPAALNPDAGALRGLCGVMGRSHDVVEEIAPGDTQAAVARKLQDFAQAGRYERVLVEVSGTTDAAQWTRQFATPSRDPASFAGWAKLQQVVCVVDLLDFHRSFIAQERGSGADVLRDFQRRMVEQATLIVLNKCDLLGDNERQRGTRLLREMNAVARIIETDYGEVPPEIIFQAASSELLVRTQEQGPADGMSSGWESAVYRAHRPFHPARFWEWFNESHAGLFRVKGLAWLATRNLLVGGVSRTERQTSCGAAGIWWAALPREDWPTDPETLAQMQGNWQEPYGDRRQELVLIGEGGAAGAAARQLDQCLLNDVEYERPVGEWLQLPDPFPAWDLASDEG